MATDKTKVKQALKNFFFPPMGDNKLGFVSSFPSILDYAKQSDMGMTLGDIGISMFRKSLADTRALIDNIRGNLGVGAIDGVNVVNTDAFPYTSSAVDDVSYYKQYVVDKDRLGDSNKTQVAVFHDGLSSTVYPQHINVYYNEGDKSHLDTTFYNQDKAISLSNKFNLKNRNSILYKTKCLFNNHKIATLQGRFHTGGEFGEGKSFNGDAVGNTAVTKNYGLSHGRNLLTKQAEKFGGTYLTNGYSNPYCRVWTYHHQYTTYRDRMMRPFYEYDKKEKVNKVRQTEDIHKWVDFKKDSNIETHKWGWKQEGADGFQYSVLNHKFGTLNIAPKYDPSGKIGNVHPKDCMFSIENLAWQGYDPYSFEKALSWEQRGPFGGRIMWFPPYGLRFSEDTQVIWNKSDFIGRGESVYTYTNTSRSGNLEFMMVVDHPSILDYVTYNNKTAESEVVSDTDIYRFFAGCDSGTLNVFAKPTPLTNEYERDAQIVDDNVKQEPEEIKPTVEEVPEDEPINVSFYVFYPNNYSGYYDRMGDNNYVEPIAYLLGGSGAQWNAYEEDITQSAPIPLKFKGLGNKYSETTGNGYEMGNLGISIDTNFENNEDVDPDNYILGTIKLWQAYDSDKYIADKNKKWYYRIDGKYDVKDGKKHYYQNTFDQKLKVAANYKDTASFQLNSKVEAVKNAFTDEAENEYLYSLAEVAYVLANDWNADENTETNVQKYFNEFGINKKDNERIQKLLELLDTRETSLYKVTEIQGVGYSNSHGNNSSQSLNKQRNDFLAKERCNTPIEWFKEYYTDGKKIETKDASVSSVEVNTQDANSLDAKKWRSAKITITIKKVEVENPDENGMGLNKHPKFKDFVLYIPDEQTPLYHCVNDGDDYSKIWYYDTESETMKLWNKKKEIEEGQPNEKKREDLKNRKNKIRYDQEYHFFKQLQNKDPHVFQKLTDKLKYFDPAFHSMTPEGFMGRLNFLHQCTRQGDTHTPGDQTIQGEHGWSANNLAFGRPPFCVLRLGDFYYQKIVINSINITYEPLVWDLNAEGIGVVPLIANVTMSFNFIGGGDMTGAVRRLQNALSFNYYANGRLYDNRADRVEYNKSGGTDGKYNAHDYDTSSINWGDSYFHIVPKDRNN